MVLRFALAAGLVVCVLAAPAGRAAAQSSQGDATQRAALIERLVDVVNRQRALNGVRPVTLEPRLSKAAQAHSDDMARRDYFHHKSPDGRDVADRVQSAGYPWRIVEENLSAGLSDPDSVVNSWMTSPEHRDNMLNPDVTDVGAGVTEVRPGTGHSRYSVYWTAVFAARAR